MKEDIEDIEQIEQDAKYFRYIVEYNWIGTKTRCSHNIQDGNIESVRQAIKNELELQDWWDSTYPE